MSVWMANGCVPGAAWPWPPAAPDPAFAGASPGERAMLSRLGYLRVATLETAVALPPRLAGRYAWAGQEPMVGIGLQLAGECMITQDGQRTVLGQGEFVLYDTARAYVIEYPRPSRAHLFHLPRRLLGVPERELQQVTGTPVTAADGFGAVLLPFLRTLADSAPSYAAPVADRLAGSVADLVGTMVAQLSAARTADDSRAPNGPLIRRIREHIERNLGDPDLSPETIARAHHISVRYLHRLFEGEGVTVGRLILRARLDASAQDLARRGPAGPPVSAVAQRWGFVSPAHFSRAFRAAYGVPPSQWRARRTAG
ncbi:helix-turn-helix domain-containing protein [Kitasatospora sp. NPDC059673]|uniref:helix-turn-helix domain-containing protein n=1 Tax=Kitasatospora sp. NPDC059673 TaxID=3346901 RepID=UPI0036B067E0